jgi:hypothetical protein
MSPDFNVSLTGDSTTRQNDNQSYSTHWITSACQLIHKDLEYEFWGLEDFEKLWEEEEECALSLKYPSPTKKT